MKRAFVVGYPINHSRSPMIHTYWLNQYGLQGNYDPVAVSPADFDHFATSLADRGFVGGNVTVPHKEAAFRLARITDPVAQSLGAVNTLWLEGSVLCGANTDVIGFLANLDQNAPGWDSSLESVVVLGAGGAARAVVYGLLQRQAGEVLLVNRTQARADALAAHFKNRVRVHSWDRMNEVLSGATLLVNTTSLGMQGQPALEIDLSPLPQSALVTDIVYVPLETRLLAMARRRGLRTVDGLGMLLHQAVPGFERWFGVRPQVCEGLRALVIASIQQHDG